MIKTKEEILEAVKARIGEDTTDEALSFIEDITDTLTDLSEKSKDTTDWKAKYEANDKEWRDKYKARFFDTPTQTTNDKLEETGATITENETKDYSYDKLFTTE